MFVPRTLRLKGIKEKRPQKAPKASAANDAQSDGDAALVNAMQGISTGSPEPQQDKQSSDGVSWGPRFTTKPITSDHIAQVAAGIQLIFSDYAHQDSERLVWLQHRYRTVDAEENFVHLTAILEHPNISTLKPEVSQKILQQAMQDHPSSYLELSSNKYYIRRRPSSYPPAFLPANSFDVVDDDGLAFWDQRTIYVEPHLRNLCQTPAKVAHWLKEHGEMRSKWLPIQAVHMLWNSCAFVVLSGSVMHEDMWDKWRSTEKPEGWKIMTKVEHTKRTAEYVEFLKRENPQGMRRKHDLDNLPPIARPAALPMDVVIVPEYTEPVGKPKGKRKRNRAKGDKADGQADDTFAHDKGSTIEEVEEGIPAKKHQG